MTDELRADRLSVIWAKAVRRVDAAIPDPGVLGALRQTQETGMANGPVPLVALMKVGRRRALDRIGRTARKDADRTASRSTVLAAPDLGVTHRRSPRRQ